MTLKSPGRKVALVTGGAKRIGKEISCALAKAGYAIALHYGRSRAQAQETSRAICKNGGACMIFACDLGQARAVEELIPRVIQEFGRIDTLINNASIFEKSNLAQGDFGLWERHWAVNLSAPYILMRSFAQRVVGQGSIINILDRHIVRNKTSYAAYLLSKKALAELTKMAALEFAPRVRVNAVAPGLILPLGSQKTDYLDRLARHVPLRRKGNPAHIAHAVLFLLENDYVTGQVIFEDGGEHLI